jgi:hypothetical protein
MLVVSLDYYSVICPKVQISIINVHKDLKLNILSNNKIKISLVDNEPSISWKLLILVVLTIVIAIGLAL